MSAVTWGSLSKAQDDPETIEECINRLILAHNEAETSHQGTGQSLESHKNSEEIDHRDYSLVEKIIKRGLFSQFNASIPIQSSDAFYINAYESGFFPAGAWIATSGDAHNQARLYSKRFSPLAAIFDKSPKLGMTIKFDTNDNITANFGMGDRGVWNYGPFVGFLHSGGNLYSRVTDEDGLNASYEEITGIDMTNWNTFVVEYTYGVGAKFYVNDVLKSTLNNSLPDISSGCPFFVELTTRESAAHEVFVKPFSFSQNN